MGIITRNFRLTNEPGALGLSCTETGLSLAGVPLVQKSDTGFVPRPTGEIEALLAAAYGAELAAAELLPAFDAIARALDRGDLAHAANAAVLTRLSELDWDDAVRLANAEECLHKYNPDEARDRYGRWTSDDGADASGQDRLPQIPAGFTPEDDEDTAFDDPDEDLNDEPADDRPALQQKYDDLGPVAFAKQVIQFGDQLGRQGQNLTPEEQAAARAEYDFLQSRLSFWFGHDNKPFEAQANLLSAAQTLYEGAIHSGVVSAHDGLPPTMLDVGFGVNGQDQPDAPFRAPSVGHVSESEAGPFERPASSEEQVTPPAELPHAGIFSRVVDNTEASIPWDDPNIATRGLAWETYNSQIDPDARKIGYNSKTFDKFRDSTSESISEKLLDPLSYTYLNDPGEIFSTIK